MNSTANIRKTLSRPRKSRPRLEPLEAVDQALARCTNIRTLAQLLAASSPARDGAGLEPEVVCNTGWLIKEQAAQLSELVRQFQLAGPAKERRR